MSARVTVDVDDLTAKLHKPSTSSSAWITMSSKDGDVAVGFHGTDADQFRRLKAFQASLNTAMIEMHVLLRLHGKLLPSDYAVEAPPDDIPF